MNKIKLLLVILLFSFIGIQATTSSDSESDCEDRFRDTHDLLLAEAKAAPLKTKYRVHEEALDKGLSSEEAQKLAQSAYHKEYKNQRREYDPEFQKQESESTRKCFKKRFDNDSEFREKFRKKDKERYAERYNNDLVFRETKKECDRNQKNERYKNDLAFRESVKARSNKRNKTTNPVILARIKDQKRESAKRIKARKAMQTLLAAQSEE